MLPPSAGDTHFAVVTAASNFSDTSSLGRFLATFALDQSGSGFEGSAPDFGFGETLEGFETGFYTLRIDAVPMPSTGLLALAGMIALSTAAVVRRGRRVPNVGEASSWKRRR